MHFFASLLAGAVLVTSVVAEVKLAFTEWPSNVTVGQEVTLKWQTGSSDAVTIILRKGDSKDLKEVAVLTTDAQNGTYEWTPSADLVDGSDYALEITQDDEVNYSGEFSISGGSVSSSVPATSTPAATVTSAASYHVDVSKSSIVGTGTVTSSRNATFKSATLSSTARSTAATVVSTSTVTATSSAKNASSTVSTGGSSSLTGSVTLILSFLAAFFVL